MWNRELEKKVGMKRVAILKPEMSGDNHFEISRTQTSVCRLLRILQFNREKLNSIIQDLLATSQWIHNLYSPTTFDSNVLT